MINVANSIPASIYMKSRIDVVRDDYLQYLSTLLRGLYEYLCLHCTTISTSFRNYCTCNQEHMCKTLGAITKSRPIASKRVVYSVHGLVWVIVSMELATKILNIMRTRV